jgi:molybdopterin/thiamine biosynthesis adenylyltransferase
MHIFQVGAGSGGMVVLDLLAREPRVTRLTLVEPDRYLPHNVPRHLFPVSGVGQRKAELAQQWLHERRPELPVEIWPVDLTDPLDQPLLQKLVRECDLGVCAVDNEPAKFAFDALMRAAGKPWTLGEVLSGGIGGWVHRLAPGGACYGCVASFLKRTVAEEPPPPAPDYAAPASPLPQATVPASRASIAVIASLHATVTLQWADQWHQPPDPTQPAPWTSLLFTLQPVPGVFEQPFRTYRWAVSRSASCLMCLHTPGPPTGETLDEALDAALARLGSH